MNTNPRKPTLRALAKPEDPWAYGVYVLIVLALIVFFWLPDLLVSRGDFEQDADWYKAKNDVRTAGIQLLGGFVLVVGSYFTARTLRLNRAGHVTDRFSKAVEHLGMPESATSLGGVYALERIMRDAPEEQGSILEILCAFVRVSERPRRPNGAPSVEVAAALRVIGRRDVANDPSTDREKFRLNLSQANLLNASLRDGNYVGANFWMANLRKAYMVRSNFDDAIFGAADMTEADVDRASFSGATYDERTQWPVGFDPEAHGARRDAD